MRAAKRVLVSPDGLNTSLALPYGMDAEQVGKAIQRVYNIIHAIRAVKSALRGNDAERLED